MSPTPAAAAAAAFPKAWLCSRGTTGASVFTADTIAEQFGVVKSSYEGVPLPARSVLTAVCKGPGRPQEQVHLVPQELPTELEWGQVRNVGGKPIHWSTWIGLFGTVIAIDMTHHSNGACDVEGCLGGAGCKL